MTLRAAPTAGMALPLTSGWPPRLAPATLPPTGPGCRDDKTRLEHDVEVESIACPEQQESTTPISADADQPIAGSSGTPVAGDADTPIAGDADAPIPAAPTAGPAGGYNLYCYDLGAAMLVAEFAHHSAACTQLVGVAVFKKR